MSSRRSCIAPVLALSLLLTACGPVAIGAGISSLGGGGAGPAITLLGQGVPESRVVSSSSLTITYATTPANEPCEYQVDSGAWTPAPANAVTVTNLAEGDHEFLIRQTKRQDVQASYAWFVDTVPPGAPPGLAVEAERAFELKVRWDAAADAAPTRGIKTYEVQWTYGGTTSSTPTTTGNATTTGLEYTIAGIEATATVNVTVRARDAADNPGQTSAADAHTDVGGDGTFASATVLAANLPGTTDVVAGDFNRDRIRDLAVLHGTSTAGNLTILLGQGANGRGNGQFVPGNTYSAPALAHAVVGDFDADRQPDLCIVGVGNGANQLTIYRGDANATFIPGTPTTLPGVPDSVLASDLDDDAILDLVVGMATGGVRVLRGNGASGRGNGTFTALASVPVVSSVRRVVVQDFDDDRNVDLLVAADGGLFLARGTGGAAFAAPQQQLVASIPTPADLLLLDTNGDRVLDPVALSADRLHVLVATTDVQAGCALGTFTFRTDLTVANPVQTLATADVDTDQIADIVTIEAASPQQVLARVLKGVRGGQGAFTADADADRTPCGTAASTVLLADLDANGAPDILVADPAQGRLDLLTGRGGLGIGDGTFFVTTPLESPGPVFPLVTADFDGNGIPDLATTVGGAVPVVAVLLSQGANGVSSGTFTTSLIPLVSPEVAVTALETPDLNGDRIPDLVTADFELNGTTNPAGTIRTFQGRGDGSFENGVIRSVGLKARTLATPLRRGRADLVTAGDRIAGGSGNVRVLRDDRPTACAPQPNLTTLPPVLAQSFGNDLFVRGLTTGDLDGDAVADLVVAGFYNANSYGAVCVYLSAGSSVIGSSPTTVTVVGYVPEAVRTGDFNGDGKTDVLVCNTAGDFQDTDVRVLFGNGLGGFTGDASLPIARANSLAIADFNADGISDVAVGLRNSAQVVVLLGKPLTGGNGVPFDQQQPILIPGVSQTLGIIAADLNTDGIQDLAVTGNNGAFGRVIRLLGRGVYPKP